MCIYDTVGLHKVGLELLVFQQVPYEGLKSWRLWWGGGWRRPFSPLPATDLMQCHPGNPVSLKHVMWGPDWNWGNNQTGSQRRCVQEMLICVAAEKVALCLSHSFSAETEKLLHSDTSPKHLSAYSSTHPSDPSPLGRLGPTLPDGDLNLRHEHKGCRVSTISHNPSSK